MRCLTDLVRTCNGIREPPVDGSIQIGTIHSGSSLRVALTFLETG